MTVVLRIKRFSGSTEVHELRAEGDYVLVPRELLCAEDVVGFDVEVTGADRFDDADVAVAGFGRDDPGGGHKVLD